MEKKNDLNKGNFIARSSHLIKDRKDINFNKYFRPINFKSFENMEITLGPKITQSDKIVVQSLIDKYNPSALLFDSRLKDDIK